MEKMLNQPVDTSIRTRIMDAYYHPAGDSVERALHQIINELERLERIATHGYDAK